MTTYDFETGTAGTASSANTGAAVVSAGTGNTLTVATDQWYSGTRSLKMVVGTANVCVVDFRATGNPSLGSGTGFGTPSDLTSGMTVFFYPAAGLDSSGTGTSAVTTIRQWYGGTLTTESTATGRYVMPDAASGLTSSGTLITQTNTPLGAGDKVTFTAVGAATNITVGGTYYVVTKTASTFGVSLTSGGTALTLGTASGIAYSQALRFNNNAVTAIIGLYGNMASLAGHWVGVRHQLSHGASAGGGQAWFRVYDCGTAATPLYPAVDSYLSEIITPTPTGTGGSATGGIDLGGTAGTVNMVTRFRAGLNTAQATAVTMWWDWLDETPGSLQWVAGPAAPASTTPVTSTLSTTWATRAAVTTTAATTWATRAAVTTTSPTSWAVRTSVNTTSATTWATRQGIAASSGTTWAVRAIVTATSATAWNVRASVSKTSATTWATRQGITATSSTAWAVKVGITRTSATTWAVRQAVTKTSGTTWATRQQVSATTSTTWNVGSIAGVVASFATTWGVRAAITKTSATTWGTRASVTASSSQTWAVRASVTNTRATTWNVRAGVTKPSATSWAVRQQISATFGQTWAVRGQVVTSTATAWDVRAGVLLLAPTAWDVRRSVTITLSAEWDTLAAVLLERNTTWATQRIVYPPGTIYNVEWAPVGAPHGNPLFVREPHSNPFRVGAAHGDPFTARGPA